MRGITYGWAVFLIIILTILLFPLGLVAPMLMTGTVAVGSLAIFLYWVYGVLITNPSGYLGCDT